MYNFCNSNAGTHHPGTKWAKYFSHTSITPKQLGVPSWNSSSGGQDFFIPPSLHQPIPTLTMNHPYLIISHHTGQCEPDWDSLLSLDILHGLALFTYVKCGIKYLLNLPRKRPNPEHSWKQFIVSLYTLTWALCHYGRSHKAERESALPYHWSQCSFMDKKHYSYIVLAWNWLC